MKQWTLGLSLVLVAVLLVIASPAVAAERIQATLEGFQEVPAVSTDASGEFRGKISADGTAIEYVLSYGELEGAVQQAHIHIGQRSVNGGIMVFLCTNLGNGPSGTQTCPASPATITGTLTAADVIGPAGQGIAPGEFAELLRAMRAGATYANVHSTMWPGGEIRGQIRASSRN